MKTILRRRTGGRIDTGGDTKAVERFAHEVHIMRQLDHHHNITRLVAGGIAADCDDLPYPAMESKRLVLTEYDRMATAT